MRRTSFLLACAGSLALLGAAWSGCYQSASDCALLLNCPGTGGAGGATSASTSAQSSTTQSSTAQSSGATTGSTAQSSGATTGSTAQSSGATTGSGGSNPCSDGTQNGTETDVDCGGATCPHCAKGKSCKGTGDCDQATCLESVCCATSSCPTCASCAVPGHEGACFDLPKGVDDLVNHCQSNATCDVGQACSLASTVGHFGDACTQGADCFNGVCQAGLCKLAVGDPCIHDVTCGSHRCTGNVCAACATNSDCAIGNCTGGVCALPGGAPCVAASDCAGGACLASKYCVQSGSEPCTPTGCITHACPGGNCATCSSAADCPLNTPCTGGSCLKPPGAFCRQPSECASGSCPPPAFLDFRRCK